jgi:superfamily I DNA/RNA helicase
MNRNEDWSFTFTAPVSTEPVLSPEQQAVADAIAHGTTDLAVVAAAGSGKTTAVIHAVTAMYAAGVDKKSILLLSFSRPAVDELNGRLKFDPQDKDAPAKTFHSTACRALNRQYEVEITEGSPHNGTLRRGMVQTCVDLNYKAKADIWVEVLNGRVANPPDFMGIEEQGAEEITLFGVGNEAHQRVVQNLTTTIARLTAEGIPLRDTDAMVGWLQSRNLDVTIAAWLTAYNTAVGLRGLWSFADALVEWYASGPRRVPVVIVDECQDMDPLLLRAAMHIAKGGRLIAVGDLRQTIHEWKGADPDVFQEFIDRPTTKTVYLNENRRSVRSIVDLGNHVVHEYAWGRPAATSLRIDEASQGWRYATAQESPLAELIKRARAALPGKQVAVLARTWSELRRFEAAAFRAGIPYTCKQGAITEKAVASFKQVEGRTWEESIAARLHKVKAKAEDTYQAIADKARTFASHREYATWYSQFYVDEAPIYLGTAHSSKGLTLDTVLLITSKKWNSPHEDARTSERRLLYVAVTRAANNLSIYPDHLGGYPDALGGGPVAGA